MNSLGSLGGAGLGIRVVDHARENSSYLVKLEHDLAQFETVIQMLEFIKFEHACYSPHDHHYVLGVDQDLVVQLNT